MIQKSLLQYIEAFLNFPFTFKQWKYVRLVILVCADIATIAFSYWLAFYLKLEKPNLAPFFDAFLYTLPVVIITQILMFGILGLYKHVLKFANIQTLILIILSIFYTTIALYLMIYLISPLIIKLPKYPPRSVPAIYFFLACAFVGIQKIAWRILSSFLYYSVHSKEKTKCFIYGAGSAGELLIRHIVSNPSFPYYPVGFIDDDTNKKGKVIHGIKILGTKKDLRYLTQKLDVSTIIITIHSAPGKVIQEIFNECVKFNLNVLIMPDIANVLDKTIIQPRAINIADLLKRSPKMLDYQKISKFINLKTVLITGAGGSIGAETCRQIAKFNPKSIVLFEACEYNLYQIHTELSESFPKVSIYPILGNILDSEHVNNIIETFKPDIIIHTAAYKHVHLVEFNLQAGVLNNILGTKIVAEAAIKNNVKNFVFISTDKAVNPKGMMGATKRCGEILITSLHQLCNGSTKFCAVRFGNVLGSSGSVVPRFMEQIQKGGPVTVTHPEVTRYFMLVSEAVGLVLQASAMSSGGEIFVLDMGEPVKIYDMAQNLIRLAGKRPHEDIEIIFTGLRPGEKLYEELILQGTEKSSIHDNIYILSTKEIYDPKVTIKNIDSIIECAKTQNDALLRQLIKSLIYPQTQNYIDTKQELFN